MALNTTFATLGVDFGLFTIIVGHATFCVVIVYNNVIARLRRLPRSLEEASTDLGADTWQTFRYITLPGDADGAAGRRPARVRAVVRRDHRHELHGRAATQTLPIWILDELSSGRPAAASSTSSRWSSSCCRSIPVYLAHG